LALFAILMTAGVGFILSSDLLLTQRLSVEQGQAAEEDIKAPRRIEFVSRSSQRQNAAAPWLPSRASTIH
jgi:hypothetical protein